MNEIYRHMDYICILQFRYQNKYYTNTTPYEIQYGEISVIGTQKLLKGNLK